MTVKNKNVGSKILTSKTKTKKPTKKANPFTVNIFAIDGKIVFCPSSHKKNKGFFPTGNDNLGCVVINSKEMVKVSKEALSLMRRIRKNRDAIGDIGWWKCDDGKFAFSWFGAIYKVMDPKTAEGDRDFNVHEDQCTIIPNSPPQEVIDGMKIKNNYGMWRKPFSLSFEGD